MVYYYNILTGESRWDVPQGDIVDSSANIPNHGDLFEDDAQWEERQCVATGNLFYVHTETKAAQWDRPSRGEIKDLGWSFSRFALEMSSEAKFATMTAVSLGLLGLGFLHGYSSEQKKYKGARRKPTPDSVSTAPGRPRRRLRSQALDPRHVAAGQAMRALGIATLGSFGAFGAVIAVTAYAMDISSAKEFGDIMKAKIPAIKRRMEGAVGPIAKSVRDAFRSSSVSEAVRGLRGQSTASENEETDHDAGSTTTATSSAPR